MINFTITKKKELAATLGERLMEKNATVASVESCTGGALASAVTDIAGSSQWFNQSWVTYSNQAKHELVGVEYLTLDKYGAVSQQVVEQMAEKGALLAKADLCIAISGIAGPGGGTADKPVGFVWFAIAGAAMNNTLTFSRRFSGDRTQVREQAVVLGLTNLIQCLAD